MPGILEWLSSFRPGANDNADWWNEPVVEGGGSGKDAVMNALTGGLYYATGRFGEDNAEAVRNASAEQMAFAERARQEAQRAGQQAQSGLDPYAQTGVDANAQLRALAGLDGPEAQRAALAQIQSSPGFMESVRASENAILANASATGGLRGGNVQAALMQARPAMLDQYINNAYSQFAGLAGAGQNAAAQQGAFGLNGAGMQADILSQQGQVASGNIIGQQAARNQGRDQAIQYGLQAVGAGANIAGGLAGFPL